MQEEPAYLPPAVEKARKAVDHLQHVLFETPFPDLDSEFSTKEQIERKIGEARSWAQAVMEAFGRPSREPGGRGVWGCFWHPGEGVFDYKKSRH